MLSKRAERSWEVVKKAVDQEKFPGAAYLAGGPRGVELYEARGCAQWLPFKRPMRRETLFDIASLSKLTGVWPGIMRLLSEGRLSLASTLGGSLSLPMNDALRGITIESLLTHTAGLTPFMNTSGSTRRERIMSLLALPPERSMGEKVVYSDLSFIFLGEILAEKRGAPLEAAAASFFSELGMTRTGYNPPAYEDFAATEIRAGRVVPQVGCVHDERATQLGGVAGHAGVFSSAWDLGLFCAQIAVPAACRALDPKWVALSYQNRTEAIGGDRGLGWVVYSQSDSGNLVGHTGFTGTSIWMDTGTGEYAVLLTNRVHPTRANDALFAVRTEARAALFPRFATI